MGNSQSYYKIQIGGTDIVLTPVQFANAILAHSTTDKLRGLIAQFTHQNFKPENFEQDNEDEIYKLFTDVPVKVVRLKHFANWLQKKAWEDMEKDFEDFVEEYEKEIEKGWEE
jgi:hypothetical protein